LEPPPQQAAMDHHSYEHYLWVQTSFFAISLLFTWSLVSCCLGKRTVFRMMSRIYRFVRVKQGNNQTIVIMSHDYSFTRGKWFQRNAPSSIRAGQRQSSTAAVVASSPVATGIGVVSSPTEANDDLRLRLLDNQNNTNDDIKRIDIVNNNNTNNNNNNDDVVDGDARVDQGEGPGDAVWDDTDWTYGDQECCTPQLERTCDLFLCRCRACQRCHGCCPSIQSILVHMFITNVWTTIFIIWSLAIFQSIFSYTGCPDGFIDCWEYDQWAGGVAGILHYYSRGIYY
jgi:hypothetical protein